MPGTAKDYSREYRKHASQMVTNIRSQEALGNENFDHLISRYSAGLPMISSPEEISPADHTL